MNKLFLAKAIFYWLMTVLIITGILAGISVVGPLINWGAVGICIGVVIMGSIILVMGVVLPISVIYRVLLDKDVRAKTRGVSND